MSSTSEIILTQNVHPGDSTSVTINGTSYKGDGYYGRADGFHTVQYNLVNFNGTIKMQGTLATTPVEADWGDIAGTEVSTSNNSHFKNFTGNFVFVRVTVTYTAGTVTSVLLNH
jgi:hypothetical protein|tara:strand:- start:22419 stop:22760 length:342 start_codon:yes stop_codon:yes gene_type:complete